MILCLLKLPATAYLEQVGRQLAELVITRIATPGLPPRQVLVPTSLLKGESCRTLTVHEQTDRSSTSPSELVAR